MATTLGDVQDAILKGPATWTAEETSVSGLVSRAAEEISLFGLNIPDNEAGAMLNVAKSLEAATFLLSPPPPPAIDWRNHQGKNFVTSIKNQRTCGACVSFATCAALESRMAIARNEPDPTLDISEAHLFYCGCGLCCRTGWRTDLALNWAANGIGLEADFPYTPKNQPCKNPSPSPVLGVPSWTAATTPLARKQAIADHGPVIAGLRVYEDFFFYKSGVYQHVTGVFRGLHAVCIVGYDDGRGCWIMKNSWGPGWGENGFMNIAYGQCDMDSTYAFYDPDVVPMGGAIV